VTIMWSRDILLIWYQWYDLWYDDDRESMMWRRMIQWNEENDILMKLMSDINDNDSIEVRIDSMIFSAIVIWYRRKWPTSIIEEEIPWKKEEMYWPDIIIILNIYLLIFNDSNRMKEESSMTKYSETTIIDIFILYSYYC